MKATRLTATQAMLVMQCEGPRQATNKVPALRLQHPLHKCTQGKGSNGKAPEIRAVAS